MLADGVMRSEEGTEIQTRHSRSPTAGSVKIPRLRYSFVPGSAAALGGKSDRALFRAFVEPRVVRAVERPDSADEDAKHAERAAKPARQAHAAASEMPSASRSGAMRGVKTPTLVRFRTNPACRSRRKYLRNAVSSPPAARSRRNRLIFSMSA